jgi:alpha-galactosidase
MARRVRALQPGERYSLHEVTPFSWYLLKLFGGFPSAQDRHVTEFFPQLFRQGDYYGLTLGVDAYSFEETIAHGDAIFAAMRELALSPDALPDDYFAHAGGGPAVFGGEHEQVVAILRDIRRDAGTLYSVNLPNVGQAPNLPPEAIIEAPAVATAAGLRPLAQPPLPAGIVGTLATRLAWVETVVEAALEGSRAKFVQALILDGAVPSVAVAEALADDLLAAQAAYLPQFETTCP